MRVGVFLLLAIVLAACGGGQPGAESVIRAWSAELNEGDYDGAAQLFAEGAQIVQGANVFVLATHEQARRWNASLPCRGRIVRVEGEGNAVEAAFVLRNRPDRPCDAPGVVARVMVRVRDGKIVLWHQLDEDDSQERQIV